MVEMNRFGILGGDKRQIYLAQSIAADGYQVYACGFDEDVEMKRVVKVSFDELTDTCGLIILPLPVTQDGKYLNMSFSKETSIWRCLEPIKGNKHTLEQNCNVRLFCERRVCCAKCSSNS